MGMEGQMTGKGGGQSQYCQSQSKQRQVGPSTFGGHNGIWQQDELPNLLNGATPSGSVKSSLKM